MNIVTFYNFTDTDFTGTWNSESTLIKAGQSIPMESWRAEHFAKHLANRELLGTDATGNRKYSNGDTHTSPKNPQQDIMFYEIYKKAIISADAPQVDPENMDMELAKVKATPKADKATKKTSDEEFEGLGDK